MCGVRCGQGLQPAHLESVSHEVRVGCSPDEGPELCHGNEARQVEYLPLEVFAIAHNAQVEELGACDSGGDGMDTVSESLEKVGYRLRVFLSNVYIAGVVPFCNDACSNCRYHVSSALPQLLATATATAMTVSLSDVGFEC